MAHGQSQGISCVKVPVFNFYAKSTLYHKADLLLGSGSVPADCHLGFARGIFEDLHSPAEGWNHSCSLGPSEFEDNLGVLAVERRFYSQMVRMVELAKSVHLSGNDVEFLIGRVGLSQIEAAHIHVVGLTPVIDTDNPETKNIGSGIYSEYSDVLISQFCRSLYMDGELQGL